MSTSKIIKKSKVGTGLSVAKNTLGVINGEKTVEEAVANIAIETTKTVASVAIAETAVGTAVGTAIAETAIGTALAGTAIGSVAVAAAPVLIAGTIIGGIFSLFSD